MIFVGTLIFFGFVSCVFGNESCNKSTDYDFYIVEKLVEDVQERIHVLKNNVKDGFQLNCQNMTCPNKSCSDGWVSFKGSCYFFDNIQRRNFQESRNFCKAYGADLLHVDGDTENSFIVGMIKRFKELPEGYYLIGLTDQGTEGVWRWIDTNTTTEYLWWKSSEPNNLNGEDCVIYYNSEPFRWYDIACTRKFGLICEKLLE